LIDEELASRDVRVARSEEHAFRHDYGATRWLNPNKALIQLSLGEVKLGCEVVCFACEYLQVTRTPVLIQDFRKPVSISRGGRE
jgi:hypothetical protein